ncbi:MAG: PEP-CTERM sorting domain-containing protein [bacterium]|nr:PEP-CTERM sorting domain-containing protein [bacterium]
MFLRRSAWFVLLGLALITGRSASAAFIPAVDNGDKQFVGEVLTFVTSGNLMNGMVVTAHFADGTINSSVWTGGQDANGGVLPLGGSAAAKVQSYSWSLTQVNDTFQNAAGHEWVLRTLNNTSNLTRLVIDARPGSVVFDRILNPEVTPDSEFGRAATQAPGTTFTGDTVATYRKPVTVGFGTPLFPNHDLYGVLDLSFQSGGVGANQTVAFWADTDNTNVPAVPEPSSAALALLMGGALMMRRRRA